MDEERRKLFRFFESNGIVNAIKAREIGVYFDERSIEKGEYFLTEGQVSREYLILESGFIRAYSFDTNGVEVTTAFYSAMQPVFEVASFFHHVPSKENIQALEHCKGWVITFDQLNLLFHTIPEFREFGRSILVQGFATLKTRMLSMITETAEERYAVLLKSNPEIFHKAPLKYIASYLGVTDTSLSRIRKTMLKSMDL
jgi:CRP-like cAMP-binding protein